MDWDWVPFVVFLASILGWIFAQFDQRGLLNRLQKESEVFERLVDGTVAKRRLQGIVEQKVLLHSALQFQETATIEKAVKNYKLGRLLPAYIIAVFIIFILSKYVPWIPGSMGWDLFDVIIVGLYVAGLPVSFWMQRSLWRKVRLSVLGIQ